MELTVKARNGKVTERQRNHIEEKLSKLERYFGVLNSAMVEVSSKQERGAGEVYRVQVTLTGERGVILRGEEQAGDLYGAIDAVSDVLQRQVQRYKDKHWRRGRLRRQAEWLAAQEPEVAVAEPEVEEDATEAPYYLIRTKEFVLKPMSTEDAVEQMELLGHNFFVFEDAETERTSILYRRRDGNYGLIVPTKG